MAIARTQAARKEGLSGGKIFGVEQSTRAKRELRETTEGEIRFRD